MTIIIDGTNGISGVDGSAGTPAYVGNDTNTGIFFPAADTIAFTEGGAEAMRIDSSGRVGIGTVSPTVKLNIYDAASSVITLQGDATVAMENQRYSTNATGGFYMIRKARGTVASPTAVASGDSAGEYLFGVYGGTNNRTVGRIRTTVDTYTSDTNISSYMSFFTNSAGGVSPAERLRITSDGNVGIGTSSPSYKLQVSATQATAGITSTTAGQTPFLILNNTADSSNSYIFCPNKQLGIVQADTSASSIVYLSTQNTERMRIDSSGNVGIGTSSPSKKLQVAGDIVMTGSDGMELNPGVGAGSLFINRGGTLTSNVQFGGTTSNISGGSGGGSSIALGKELITFLTFPSTTNAGDAITLTERMRINSSGTVLVGKTSDSLSVAGAYISPIGEVGLTQSAGAPLYINRLTNDGVLVQFRQDNSNEGDISVSGSTVSYNGGHLSRWSQLPDGTKDNTILKGTVMSNLDDMCVWEKDGVIAENEQLNKMKVSDVEGDTNVAGVFVNWTIDADYGVDDMNVAMTGDMIIRIADGVVVQKGDLLMSAGDGTAKPQGDDIVRSKTIAKVTSNHVTCTYTDGSYCVPCVLMAC